MASPVLSLDADQQTSAVDKGRPQDDRWRSEEISTHRGQSFTLLVVVDGEGETAPGEAASLAVEIAFAEARLRRDDPLPGLLAHLLRQMNEVVFHRAKGDMVGVTLAAIQELYQELKDRDVKIASLESRLEAIEALLQQLAAAGRK